MLDRPLRRMSEAQVKPAYWQRATTELASRDTVLARLIATHRGIDARPHGDAFSTLARAIIGQQISVSAAQTIWQRSLAAIGEASPDTVLACDIETLRACGLSARKLEYLRDLARWFIANDHGAELERLGDSDLIARLCQIKGIGRWTAEMFMIFYLHRPDVLPLDDLGLVRGVSRCYRDGAPLTKREVADLTAHWAPWRSVGTWYMWRALSPMPIS